jgi:hypothetical protein
MLGGVSPYIFEEGQSQPNRPGHITQHAVRTVLAQLYTLYEWNIFDPTLTVHNTYHSSAVYMIFPLLPCLRGCAEQDFQCFRQ